MTQEKQLVSKDIFSVSVSHDGSTLLYTKLSKITAKSPTQFEYKFKDIQLYFPENKANDSNFSDYGFAKDWSRDNKTVLFANENKLVIFNTETNDKKTIKIED
jgi:hypothetical protein